MGKKQNSNLPNLDMLACFGIDPKWLYSNNMLKGYNLDTKSSIKRLLRITDEQEIIHRYEWKGLPEEIDPELLERILYYHGQAMLFYMEQLDRFYVLPYALSGTIDVYGRYTEVTPLPFNGGKDDDGNTKPWILGLKREPVYKLFESEEKDGISLEKAKNTKCVLIKDYTEQRSQHIIARQMLNEGLIDIMANMIPYMDTALINSTGVSGMRVGTADESSNVDAANRAMKNAAINGEPYVPVIGYQEFQNLNESSPAKAQEFMQAFQSLYNFKHQTEGITNGGVFEKKAHMLEDEQDLESSGASAICEDGLRNRQKAAERASSWLGVNISCEIKQTSADEIIGTDGMNEYTYQSGSKDTSKGEYDE